MKNAIQMMQAPKPSKNGAEKKAGKVRTTISIDDDLAPGSEKVRLRMKERRAASYSNFIEVLIAEDICAKPAEAVPA